MSAGAKGKGNGGHVAKGCVRACVRACVSLCVCVRARVCVREKRGNEGFNQRHLGV